VLFRPKAGPSRPSFVDQRSVTPSPVISRDVEGHGAGSCHFMRSDLCVRILFADEDHAKATVGTWVSGSAMVRQQWAPAERLWSEMKPLFGAAHVGSTQLQLLQWSWAPAKKIRELSKPLPSGVWSGLAIPRCHFPNAWVW